MPFGDNFESLFPSYLVDSDKGRLRNSLKQFIGGELKNEIDYSDFYKEYHYDYFMQSDLIREIRFAYWDEENKIFQKRYTDGIILSNTCDISFDNTHSINEKQCLFAPVIELADYIIDLIGAGLDQAKISQFIKTIKSQQITNILYLPANHNNSKEYVVLLDNVFWFPIKELKQYTEDISSNKISSLGYFGYYLFILKLSYHLCRLPEQCDREVAA